MKAAAEGAPHAQHACPGQSPPYALQKPEVVLAQRPIRAMKAQSPS
jgi:hypothetical protein